MYGWSSGLRKDYDPTTTEPIFTRLFREWNHPPLFVRMLDERGYPPWLRPSPSLRLLARPPDPYPIRIRYSPRVAPSLTASSPARHLEQVTISDEDEEWWPPAGE